MWNKIKDNWNLIATVIIICMVFLWGKSCGNKVIEPTESKVVTVTNYRDTIFPVDTFYSHEIIPGKPRIIHDTVPVYYLDSASCNRYYIYDDTIRDSKYDVISRQIVQGRLSSSNIKVKLKVPLIIKDSTVVKIDSLIYRPYKYEIHAGGIVGFNTAAITADLSVDKCTYGFGYDFINKAPLISFKYRLFGWTPKKK
jgi:hypothetical protein